MTGPGVTGLGAMGSARRTEAADAGAEVTGTAAGGTATVPSYCTIGSARTDRCTGVGEGGEGTQVTGTVAGGAAVGSGLGVRAVCGAGSGADRS
ncbi:hypothetical protein ACLB9X_06025 [Streptomyces sp. 5K101]|uniref:hypothetical protein n=1 Tax=Streptomyces sp. 5K101 TaxID=3390037 RepID=UPI003976DE46